MKRHHSGRSMPFFKALNAQSELLELVALVGAYAHQGQPTDDFAYRRAETAGADRDWEWSSTDWSCGASESVGDVSG